MIFIFLSVISLINKVLNQTNGIRPASTCLLYLDFELLRILFSRSKNTSRFIVQVSKITIYLQKNTY